jgi:hypothetical protein
MNVINNINCRINTPTLADKSLHSFKSIKPEVQSSRLCRPETSKLGGEKNGINFYGGYSREKDKGLEMGEKG